MSESSGEGRKILIVEDEAIVGLAMRDTLLNQGYVVPEVIDSGDNIISAVMSHKPDLILMDIRINSFIDGVDAAKRIEVVGKIPIVYVTAHGDPATKARAAKTAPSAYLIKPVDERTLLNTVKAILS